VIVALVGAGAGVAIVPRSLALRALAGGLLSLRLGPDGRPRRAVVAIRPPNARSGELVDWLIELMKSHAAAAGRPDPAQRQQAR